MSVVGYRVRWLVRGHLPSVASGVLAVAIVGTLVLALFAGARRTESAPDRYEAARSHGYQLIVEQTSGPSRGGEIAALPAVAQVASASFVFGGLIPDGSTEPVDALVFAGAPDALGADLVAGRAASGASEFVATRAFVKTTRAKLGDRFQLVTVTQHSADANGFNVPAPDGPTVPATLVGVADAPSELGDGYGVALFPSEVLAAGDIGTSGTEHAVTLAPGATEGDLRAQLASLGGATLGIRPAELVPAAVRSAVRAQSQGLLVLTAIVAVAATVVLGQLLVRQVRLTQDQRHAMRAMGMSPAQAAADQVARAVVPLVFGLVLAGVAALALSGRFPAGFARAVEPEPGVRYDPWAHGLGAVVLAGAVAGWVALAVWLGERTAALPRPSSAVDAVARRLPAPAAVGARFAFTRQGRDRVAARAPLVGLLGVLTVLVAALTFGATLGHLVSHPAAYGAPDLLYGAGGNTVPDDVVSTLTSDPDVAGVALGANVLATAKNVSIDIGGLQPVTGDLGLQVHAGRLAQSSDEIALGRVTARDLHVRVGDTLTVETANGATALRVVGIAVIPGIAGGDGVGQGGLVTDDGLRRLDPAITFGNALVVLRSGGSGETMARLSSALGQPIGPGDAPSDIVNLSRIRSIPYVIAAALALLLVLSLGHQLLLSAQQRMRDLAVLHALGARPRWLTAVLHWQASLFTLLAAVVAAPLGYVVGRVAYRVFIDRLGAGDTISVPVLRLVLALLALLVLANVVAVMPAYRRRRVPPARLLTGE